MQSQSNIGTYIFILMVSCSFLKAELYEVGPDKPYKTLQDVNTLLNAGDTVLVEGDQTYPGGVTFSNTGMADMPIVIKGIRVNNRRPVLSGGTNTITFSTYPYDEPGADHYILEGFEITGGSKRGIFHQAHDLTVRDCVVHDCPEQGILGADEGSGSLTLEFVEVYGCGSGTLRHQLYISTDQINHPGSVFRMQFCYIHDGNGGNNLKSRAERNEIYYNWFENAYYHELELIGPELGEPELKREDSDVVGNVIWDRNDFYLVRIGGDGTGETNGRYRFVNNTFISNSHAVFRLFDGLESVEMHNNVFFRLGNGAPVIMSMDDANWFRGFPLISGQNNWAELNSQAVPSQWTGTIAGDDPGFINVDQRNLHLGKTSSLINAGVNSFGSPDTFYFPNPLPKPLYVPPPAKLENSASPRPQDDTLDIGAYETVIPDAINSTPFKSAHFVLDQNYPNPFNNKTRIRLRIKEIGLIKLIVYGSDGRKSETLVEDYYAPGTYVIDWNTRSYSSGTYIIRLIANGYMSEKKCVLLK